MIGGAVGGLAGALMVNQQNYVNPNLLYWTQSGTLMIMVILGGVGTLWGGVLGAVVLCCSKKRCRRYTIYWQFWVGWILLAFVLFARKGLAGVLERVLSGRRAFHDGHCSPSVTCASASAGSWLPTA